jgi:phosphatidate phosphatase PAH1
MAEMTDPICRSPFSPFHVRFTDWSLLEIEVYKKHCSVSDLVRPMMMKRIRRWS